MTRLWLGLGANLGDRHAALQGAVNALFAAGLHVEAVSTVYETAPRDMEDQPPFLNAACRVRTARTPPEVLALAKEIEVAAGRRSGPRFGPRPIDVDLLVWEGGAWSTPDLEIPHPRLAERRFALEPMIDLDPDLMLPDGSRIADLVARISTHQQPVEAVADRLLVPVDARAGL